MLLLRELLAGSQLRRRGRGPGVEARHAQRRQAGGHPQEVAAPYPDRAKTRRQQVQLLVRDMRNSHAQSPRYFSLGSSASLTPSPKKVNDSMVTAMAIDGNTHRCQYDLMYCCPSPTICPHDGVGGLIPTPMNESAASVKIASGIPKVMATTIGVSALGRMWRTIRRRNPAPSAR